MPKLAANLTMMFTEVPFLDRFEAAARAGFTGVEYLFPYDYEIDRLISRLRRFGLYQILHNLPAGDWAAGERGIACHPDRVREFREGVELAIDYAIALGCRQVNCLAGIPPHNADPERVHRVFVENLGFAARELKRAGIRLLIEPINPFDIPGFYLQTVEQAAAVIDEVGSDNLFIQYDLYHQQRTKGELVATFRQHKHRIAHIQLADNPGRHEPGTGEINFPRVFELLGSEGYAGWIGCEYKPLTTTAEGLAWTRPYLRREPVPAHEEVPA